MNWLTTHLSLKRTLGLAIMASLGAVAVLAGDSGVFGHNNGLDPAFNTPLPCEVVSTPGSVARASENLEHVANVCGLVGTDIEFQSRTDRQGRVHDYAFLGTMGAGFRIFDITDPENPTAAGAFLDSGWQNDIQVEGHLAVSTFDGVVGEDSSASTCLKERYPEANGQGVDIFELNYNKNTAKFAPTLLTCVANPPGGAHNATLNPRRQWLAVSNCCSDWALDVIDLRPVENNGARTTGGPDARHTYRLIDASRKDSAGRCPENATFKCIVIRKPGGGSASGLFDPHDVHFSRNGRTMYVAAIEGTFILKVAQVLEGKVRTIGYIPNISESGGLDNTRNIEISHQADVTADGKILVIADEKGGGVSNQNCNTETGDKIIGGLHFWALGEIKGIPQSVGAKPSRPKKLGYYANPNPGIGTDPLQVALESLPRFESACTVHVFRIGKNGSSSPGSAEPNLDGVSSLRQRQLVTAWYGAGTWWVDFSGPPDAKAGDRIDEEPTTTWGNTLGYIVMPGASTWSSKEYKGHIYTGDMTRGMDVFRFSD